MLGKRFWRVRAHLREATRGVPLATGGISLAGGFAAAQRRQLKRPLVLELSHLAPCSAQEPNTARKGNQERKSHAQPHAESHLHPGLLYMVSGAVGGRPSGVGRSRAFSICENDIAGIAVSIVFDPAGGEVKGIRATVANIVGRTSPVVKLALTLPQICHLVPLGGTIASFQTARAGEVGVGAAAAKHVVLLRVPAELV